MLFRLHKWYLDCIAADGCMAIVYAARLSLGVLRLPWAELLLVRADGRTEISRRLCGVHIEVRDRAIELDIPALGVEGSWTSWEGLLEAPLLTGRTSISWRCLQPVGVARLRLPGGEVLGGTGYAEEICMDHPPWALPFRELRWGRFHAGRRSLVWIDWRDGLERNWTFLDGAPVVPNLLGDLRIEWPGGRLDLEPRRVIRDADLGSTVAGRLAFLLPRGVARARETKHLSSGTLLEPGEGPLSGWAIHEVVRWP